MSKLLNWKTAAAAMVLWIALLSGLLYAKRAHAAVLTGTCRTWHHTGYYRLSCGWPNPTSFSVRAYADQPYRVQWNASCESKVRNKHIGSAAVAIGGDRLRSGEIVIKPTPVFVRVMLADVRCRLDVTFSRVRPAASHFLAGVIFLNGRPQLAMIYDHTAAGQ